MSPAALPIFRSRFLSANSPDFQGTAVTSAFSCALSPGRRLLRQARGRGGCVDGLLEASCLAARPCNLCLPPASSCSLPRPLQPSPPVLLQNRSTLSSHSQASLSETAKLFPQAPGSQSARCRGCPSKHIFSLLSNISKVQTCNLLTFANNKSEFLSSDLNFRCSFSIKIFPHLCRAFFFPLDFPTMDLNKNF